MNGIVILGSTGSIGTQTLNVLDNLTENWNVLALSANTNIDLLSEQARKYRPDYVVIMRNSLVDKLEEKLKDISTEVLSGEEGLKHIASLSGADIVINALVGAIGLRPSISALEAGKKLGLANKESMVIGGSLMNKKRDKYGGEILPIDSEHNAIFQILNNHSQKEIKKILLTASGGPFLNYSKEQLKNVTREQALDHPNWNMGPKITIDSATMMNKGLEVIEAHHLFKQPINRIKVVIHPQSIIHSMVEFIDNSIMAELGVSDMRIPIQNIITYPDRMECPARSLDLFQLKELTFLEPDFSRFPALDLACEAGKKGGSMPIVLNAANEVAVSKFLNKKIPFVEIPSIVEEVLERHKWKEELSLADIYSIDDETRRIAREVCSDVNNSN